MLVDFHIHTCCSDGIASPEDVVELMCEKGVDYYSITDHDTVEGTLRAQTYANEKSAKAVLVSGIEVSCEYEGRDMHMLGYGIDVKLFAQQDPFSKTRESRTDRTISIVRLLQKEGYQISEEELLASGETVNRTAIARRLVKTGSVASVDEAFDTLIGEGCPFFVKRQDITALEAISIIDSFGGISVMAHPWLYHVVDAIWPLSRRGLKGIEAFHGEHPHDVAVNLSHLADELGLLVTGGSDWHGDGVHAASLCSVEYPKHYLERFIAQLGL